MICIGNFYILIQIKIIHLYSVWNLMLIDAISMKRIQKYLFQDEINPANIIKKDKYMDINIQMYSRYCRRDG